MKTERRRVVAALLAFCIALPLPALGDTLETVRSKARLRVAVYNDYPPYAFDGRGIDVDIGRALAERLGVQAEIVAFNADEDMNDDLRNMVWKGHYLGTQPADVMLHVPLDPAFAAQNDKVRIFAPYHREHLALARLPERVPEPSGSAAQALAVFSHEKIGVELASGADAFLLGVLAGRLRENVVHYRNVAQAAAGMRRGEVQAVLAPRAELEGTLRGDAAYPVSVLKMPELRGDSWPLALAVKHDDTALAEALDAAMRALRQDGSLQRIFERYGVTLDLPGV